MRNRLDELKNNRMKYQASLKDSYKNIIAEIKALRKEINQILDKVEKETVEQLDSMMKDLEKSIKADLEACAHIYDELDTMIEKLQQLTGKNKETNSFIGFGKCHSKLSEANCLVKEIRGKERVEFKSDESVLQLLGNLSRLGNVAHDLFIHVNKAQSSRHYQVRIKNDKKTCLIDGICELPSGEMVLADRSNKRVKLLNKQFEVIDHSDMPGNPQHLCHITGNEVAVVVCDCISNEVHFLTVTKEKLQSMRKFTTDHNCVFIAHHQGQLYVGSMDGLYLYTMAGRLLKKIYEDLSGLLEVYSCAVSPSGERIYVSNYYSSKLITLCTSGQVLSTVKDPTLQDPTGLCVSPSGHVFVCGHGSNTVVLVDKEGRHKLATVARKADGVYQPRSVWFSENTSTLIVGNYADDEITVIRLC
ncbi:uncharacterized protein LOC128244393 [Mya arenaria]|uniref:uncharacterized protein LOC128244393 n=1 Tax=Mya arenaria TaxID=6604 RepID=UPI0022E728D3|nr:uncharacterized protein LOC128244393 [Mya arenaria]